LFTPRLPSEALTSYDIVHVHGIDGMFDRVALEPRRPGQVVIATTHGLFFHTTWMRTAKQIYFHTVTRAAAQRYDAIIATSEADQKIMRRVRSDVVHIPNGVTPLPCSAQGRHLLSHGRLASHKRLDLLVDALACPALGDVVLHIVGPEWDVRQSALREHATNRGVADRVCLHGAVSADRLCDIASACGAFVCASEYEGFGMALIEALSAGLTAVVAPNASFTEIVRHAPVGRLADFRDAASAAQIIRHELDGVTPATREAARVYAEQYSWRRNAARTLEVYEAAQTRQRLRAA
jgi:alpha-1,3-mannosyltransferase